MKIKDIKVGDECWFVNERIRITNVERSESCIVLTFDIVTDIFNNGEYSFHVFYQCDWDKDIETLGKSNDAEDIINDCDDDE